MQETILVLPEEAGQRIDRFLADKLEEFSRSAITRMLDSGEISFADGTAIRKNHKTQRGDSYCLNIAPPEVLDATPENIPLEIVYEDDCLIVINKARGMVVHPAPGHSSGTVVNALLYHTGESLSGIGGVLRPGIVHRLDKDTSGLMVVAKSDLAHTSLSAQLKDRSLQRIYEAVTIGRIGRDEGVIDAPIGRHPQLRKQMSVHSPMARPATTYFKVLDRFRDYSHVQCQLETGRTHQIRVHLKSIGHPVLGDMVYGRPKPEKGLSGQCLHAKSLAFSHPQTGKLLHFDSDLPQYFTEALGKLGAKDA